MARVGRGSGEPRAAGIGRHRARLIFGAELTEFGAGLDVGAFFDRGFAGTAARAAGDERCVGSRIEFGHERGLFGGRVR